MPRQPQLLNTAQRNLKAIIDNSGLKVNAWAVKYKLDQSTISRIVRGEQDMTSVKMQDIARKAHFPAWHLLIEDFSVTAPPVLVGPETDAEQKLYAKLQRDIQALAELREAYTRPGELR